MINENGKGKHCNALINSHTNTVSECAALLTAVTAYVKLDTSCQAKRHRLMCVSPPLVCIATGGPYF